MVWMAVASILLVALLLPHGAMGQKKRTKEQWAAALQAEMKTEARCQQAALAARLLFCSVERAKRGR